MMGSNKLLKRLVLFLALAAVTVGLSAAVFNDYKYSPFDKEFYLTDEQVAFVRPGLNITVDEPVVMDDGTVWVDFQMVDDAGLPLDIDGVDTPGSIRVSFVLAYIPRNRSTYRAYTTRVQTSPITGNSAEQASSDSGGVIEELETGMYRYTFGTQLPENFQADSTHTVGYYAERDLEDFGLGAPMDDGVVMWVPNGGEVEKIRELVTDEACSNCHGFLRVHGRRHSYQLCITCHYPGVIDPDTGNTVDFREMIHKIHAGEHLPSVQAGEPYQIIGFRQSVHDYSEVVFPQDLRYCDSCHVQEAAQHEAYFLNPTRSACGSCHDDVNFQTGENHAGGPARSDRFCANCHFPEGEFEFDASVLGAHKVPAESEQLEGINIDILDVTNAGPGQAITVMFSLMNDAGEPIEPADLPFFNLVMAGPNTDYTVTVSESAQGAVPVSGGTSTAQASTWAYTFNQALPVDATGSYTVGAEIFRNVPLNPGTVEEFMHRETAENPVYAFAVTDAEPVMRRAIVTDEKCEACHRNLALHGTIRHNANNYCQVCHTPLADDSPFRPEDQLPARSIDFKMLIHRIHTGEELTRDYTQIGFMGRPVNYNHVLYPGNLQDCEACHVDDSYNVPTPGVVATIAEREFFSPIPPNSAACLGCHDSVEAAAHAYTNISFFGEACGSCHGEGAEFAVARVHAE